MVEEDSERFPELFGKKRERRSKREIELDKLIDALKEREEKLSVMNQKIEEYREGLRPTNSVLSLQIDDLLDECGELRRVVRQRARELDIKLDDEIVEEFVLPGLKPVRIEKNWDGKHAVEKGELKRRELRKHVMRIPIDKHPAKKGKLLDYYSKQLDVSVPTLKRYINDMRKDRRFLRKFIDLAGEKKSLSRYAQMDFDKGRKVTYPFDEHPAVMMSDRRDAIYTHVMKTSFKRHPAEKGGLEGYYADKHNVSKKVVRRDLNHLMKRPDFKKRYTSLRKYR
jgi:DNA repair exonuclease SbcCD ATPase subunit